LQPLLPAIIEPPERDPLERFWRLEPDSRALVAVLILLLGVKGWLSAAVYALALATGVLVVRSVVRHHPGMLKIQEQELRDTAAQEAQKSTMVDRHGKSATEIIHMYHKLGTDAATIQISHNTPDMERVDARVKSVMLSDISELPIHVRTLRPGTTHTGRVLRGKVVVQANQMTSVQTVIVDESGDCVRVHIYTVPDRRNSLRERLGIGARVAVVSPFFKLMADGRHGVRVDDAPGTFFLLGGPEADVDRWREEARSHFQHMQFFEAELAYTHALRLLSSRKFSLCHTLSRLAHAHLLLGADDGGLRSALAYAAAAFTLDLASVPAVAAMALALHGLGFPAHANGLANFVASQAAIKDGGMSSSCATLLSSPVPSGRTTSSPASDLIVATALLIEGRGRISVDAPSAVTDTKSVELGDESLKAGRIHDAITYFRAALCTHSDVAAVLLSNRAQTRLMLSFPEKALLDANASLILQPENIKSHYRRATALLKLREPWLAVEATTVDPVAATTPDLVQLREKVQPDVKGDSARKIVSNCCPLTLQLHSDWFYPAESRIVTNYTELMERFRSAAEVSHNLVTRDKAYERLSAAIIHAAVAIAPTLGSVVLAFLETELCDYLHDLCFKANDRIVRYGDASYDPVAWERRKTRTHVKMHSALSSRFAAGTLQSLDPAEAEFWRHYSEKQSWQGLNVGRGYSRLADARFIGLVATSLSALYVLISWRDTCLLELNLSHAAGASSVTGLDPEKMQLWKTTSRKVLSHRVPPDVVVGAVTLVLKVFSSEVAPHVDSKPSGDVVQLAHSVDSFVEVMSSMLADVRFRSLMSYGTGALIREEWERNQSVRATLLQIQSIWTAQKKDSIKFPIPETTCDVCGEVSVDYKQFRLCSSCKVHLCSQSCFAEHTAKKHKG
jgi:hypothetical protein